MCKAWYMTCQVYITKTIGRKGGKMVKMSASTEGIKHGKGDDGLIIRDAKQKEASLPVVYIHATSVFGASKADLN